MLQYVLMILWSSSKHFHNVREVLCHFDSAGACLRKEKCAIKMHKINYLGQVMDEQDLHPSPDRVKAIIEAPSSCLVSELKSFFWLLNYYCKSLPNLSFLFTIYYRRMSVTLAQAEKKYSQLDNEAPAIVLELKKFH